MHIHTPSPSPSVLYSVPHLEPEKEEKGLGENWVRQIGFGGTGACFQAARKGDGEREKGIGSLLPALLPNGLQPA